MRTLVLFFLMNSFAWANDVIVCDPTNPQVPNAVTRFETTANIPETNGYLVYIAPNNLMTPEKQAYMVTLKSQMDSMTGIPLRYWLCKDSDANGTLDAVIEMTQAQKDLEEAPRLALQALSAEADTLNTEIEADDTNWAGMNTTQKLAVAKKLLRREVLRQKLAR